MNLRKNPKSGTYHATFTDGTGKRHSVTTRCTDRTEALKVVRSSGIKEMETVARTDRLTHEVVVRLTVGKKITVEQCYAQWSDWLKRTCNSQRTALNSIDCVAVWIRDTDSGKRPATAITDEHLDAWLNDPEKEAKASTRLWHRACLSKFFFYCQSQNWILKNPVATAAIRFNNLSHQQKERKRKPLFSKEEVAAVLCALDKDSAEIQKRIEKLSADTSAAKERQANLQARLDRNTFWLFATRLSWETGLRLGDITQLEWACFDPPRHITVWTDKRDRRVCLPISDEIGWSNLPILSAQYLFPSERITHLDTRNRAQHSTQFSRLLASCGIHGKGFHCLRHTWVARMRTEEHKTWDDIAESLGHASTNTSRQYGKGKV